MDPMEAIRATFFQECDELLGELEGGLLDMQAGSTDTEIVNAVFRAVHSIKGGAGAFGLDDLVAFAHIFETTMDEVRAGRMDATPEVTLLLLRSADVLADHVGAAKGGPPVDPVTTAVVAGELTACVNGPNASFAEITIEGEIEPEPDFGFTPLAISLDAIAPSAAPEAPWRVVFTPMPGLYHNGNDPLRLLRAMQDLGEVETRLDLSRLPALDDLDVDGAWLTFDITVTGDGLSEATLREVFEFVEGHCDLQISQVMSSMEEETALDTSDDDPEALIARLIREATTPGHDGASAAAPEVDGPTPPEPASPPPPATEATANEAPPAATIRVDLERVDRLIDLVGELVINQAMLAQRVGEAGLARSGAIALGLEDLEQLTREIQDSVMAIRAQPVKAVFQRMPRLVREVAAATGKQVRLVTEGETTEVDKTVIERLSDPITHMIRNAIDHGLETPENRLEAGKTAEGTVRLSALHRSGRIVIEVADDGRGINRERVRAIAIERGIISAEVVLSDEEIDNLIFAPGFSTAETISNISGRGVGMDVVKRSIQALGGRIGITSRPGEGSVFTLSLPLTLAVLDGMVVSVGGQTLVVPISVIVETLKPKPSDVRALGATGAVLTVRDTQAPIIDVATAMGWKPSDANRHEGVTLLVEGDFGGLAALQVDSIQGQRQVVIKSLEQNYRQVPGVAAATILGDGRVALIVDVDGLVAVHRRGRSPALPLALAS